MWPLRGWSHAGAMKRRWDASRADPNGLSRAGMHISDLCQCLVVPKSGDHPSQPSTSRRQPKDTQHNGHLEALYPPVNPPCRHPLEQRTEMDFIDPHIFKRADLLRLSLLAHSLAPTKTWLMPCSCLASLLFRMGSAASSQRQEPLSITSNWGRTIQVLLPWQMSLT